MTEPNGVYGALSAAQAEFPPITKDRTVTVQTRTGGSYRFAYAPLDSIIDKVRPVLAKHGLALSQVFSVTESGGPALETILAHTDGSMIRGALPLPAHSGTAQEFGGVVTYYRRYSLVAILGLATEEDDDANGASGNTVQRGDGQATDPHGLQESRGDAPSGGATDKQKAMIRRLEKKLGLSPETDTGAFTKAQASNLIEELLAIESNVTANAEVTVPADDLDDVPF